MFYSLVLLQFCYVANTNFWNSIFLLVFVYFVKILVN